MRTELADVQNLILNAVREMNLIRTRDYRGLWRDSENDAGIIIACEAICCFLLSHQIMEDHGIKIIGNTHVVSEEEIQEMIMKVLERCDTEGLNGYPYLNFKKACPRFAVEPDYVDTASFLITTLCSFWQMNRDELLREQNKNLSDSIRRSLVKALEVMDESYVDGESKGWSWGREDKPDQPFLYYSWTIAETVTDLEKRQHILRDIPEAGSIANRLFERIGAVRDWFEHRHLSDDESAEQGVQYDARKGRVVFPNQDHEPHYNIWILLLLLQTGCRREQDLKASIDVLKAIYDNDKAGKHIGRLAIVPLDGKELLKLEDGAKLEDRCYLPQLLKSVALFVNAFPQHAEEYGGFLDELYERLRGNISRKSYLFVWDAAKDYSIYYTERAIEALCEVHSLLAKAEPVRTEQAENRPSERASAEIIADLADEVGRRLGMQEISDSVRMLSEQLELLAGQGSGQKRKKGMDGLEEHTNLINKVNAFETWMKEEIKARQKCKSEIIAQEQENAQKGQR